MEWRRLIWLPCAKFNLRAALRAIEFLELQAMASCAARQAGSTVQWDRRRRVALSRRGSPLSKSDRTLKIEKLRKLRIHRLQFAFFVFQFSIPLLSSGLLRRVASLGVGALPQSVGKFAHDFKP